MDKAERKKDVERLLAMEAQEQSTEELWGPRPDRQAMDEFATRTENIRFKETRENWRAMMEFLTDQDLPVTAPNLRFAFLVLSKRGELSLLPLGQLAPSQPPQPEPTPTPTAQPAPAVPVTARTFRMYRNGNPITGNVRSL